MSNIMQENTKYHGHELDGLNSLLAETRFLI